MNNSAWQAFDEDTGSIIGTTSGGSVESRLNTFTRLIYTMGKERLGVVESRRVNRNHQTTRREKEIKDLRKHIRGLNQRFQKAAEVEKIGLGHLTDQLRAKLKDLRQVENLLSDARSGNLV